MSLRARPPIAMPEAAAPLTSSLLAGDEPARSLFELRDDATRRAELAAVDHPRAELVALLLEQALARGAGPEARAPIRLLARPDVVVVATGQQIGVLGGPLYTLYKALAAVSHARALTRAGVPAVAVFWMASFDHDLAEVARAALLTGDATPRRVALAVPDTGCPVGHLRPGAAIDALHDEVARALASLPHARVTVNALRRCYRPEVSLADAFARWFGALMDPLGLILLDPADRRFAALTRPLLARALFDAPGSAEAAARGRAAMRARGLTPAIGPRPRGRLGVFFTAEDGRRVPLLRDASGFSWPHGHLRNEDARRLLDEAPERFTPDALLRPVAQDLALPTIACVLGPGELRYHAQLGPLYRWAGVPRPQPLLRPRLTLLDDRDFTARERAASRVDAPARERLVARAGLTPVERAALTRAEQQRARVRELHARLDRRDLRGAAACVEALARDPSAAPELDGPLSALRDELARARTTRGVTPRRRALRTVAGFYRALERALTKHGRTSQRSTLRRLRAVLPPPGSQQERTMTVAQLLAWLGPDAARELLGVCAPPSTDPARQLVVLETSSPAARVTPPPPPMPRPPAPRELTPLPDGRGAEALRALRRLRLELTRSYRARLQQSLRSSGARPLPTDAEPLAIGLLAMGGVGGSGRVARAVARGLADRGHHVHLFSSDDPHWNDSQLDWVTTHRIGLQDTPQPPERVDAAAAARLAEQLRRHQLRVLNVHYASGLLGVALAARDRLGRAGLGVRVCASLHGTDVTSWTSPDERALEGHAPLASGDALTSRRVLAEQLRRCDAITTVSRWLAVRARAAFDLPEEPIVIPNAVESRLFHPRPARALRARLTRDDDELLLAHVSNLRPVKRSGDAVELLARVRAAGVPARLVLMGDGPEAAAVTRLAAALGVREHVHMTGALQPGPLARHLAACDLALVTSASESFSLAALEAMACGLPVLGTRCGGLEEVVQRLERADEPRADERVEPGPLSRLLVDVGDVAAMAARVLELLGSDAELRAISELLLRASLGPFREHAQVARYLAVYRGALRTDDARDRDGRGTLDAAPACP